MKVYGHPWSINTRKTLFTLAEKGHETELILVMLPKGEQKRPEHIALHPFGKVPVLNDDGFVLYEARAINQYLDRVLQGPTLTPSNAKEQARMEQWINVADAYFVPFAHQMIVELLFRPFLGGEQNTQAISAGRAGIQHPLDTIDTALGKSPYLAGETFSLADIHWMPYLEYLQKIGEGEAITQRKNLSGWWRRVSERPAWQKVARTGPQPYDPQVRAEVIEALHRR